MRTEKPTSAASAVARFRSQIVRGRRAIAAQGPAFRWSLALGVLGVLMLLGYLAAPVPAGSAFLRAGQLTKFPSGDIIKITHGLDAQKIDYRVDDQGRIEVASDRLEDARTVLAKMEIGPKSIEELDRAAKDTNPWWDGPGEKEQRQNQGREAILAAMIRKFDGIISAYVTINRPKPRGWLRPGAGTATGERPTAFVWLETEGGREIGHKTVQSIQNLIVGNEPDVKIDAVTVFDQKGRHYLVAGDPRYRTISATRAREEDLRQRILEPLDWVDGVRVTVQLVPVPATAAAAAQAPTPPAEPLATPATAPLARSPEPYESSVGVNSPLELEPEPRPNPDPTATRVVAASALPEPPAPAPRGEAARVWVWVPRSYYFSKAAPGRDLSPDGLKPIIKRTEELILRAIEAVVPPELTPPEVKIDTFPYDEPASVPLRSPVATDVHRPLSWWLPAAMAAGGLIVLLSAWGVRVLAWRRPAVRQPRVAAPHPGRYRSDAASEPGPGPAERVRELIRLNPEAAASVLHRWIGQGESLG